MLESIQQILNAAGLRIDASGGLVMLAMTMARLVSAITLTPFLGGASVPSQVKVGLAFALSVLLLPFVAPAGTAPPGSPLELAALVTKEVMIGALIGFSSQLVFFAVQMAGTIVDTQRGLNQISYTAPSLPGHSSILGSLQLQAAIVLFLSMDGHLIFIRTLAMSYRILPLLTFPAIKSGLLPVAEHAIRLTAKALILGCQLAAPVVIALFLIDLAFASVGRVAHQIKISSESNTFKAIAALPILLSSAALMATQLNHAFAALVRSIGDLLLSLV